MSISAASPLRGIDRQCCLALALLLLCGIVTLYSLSYIAEAKFSSAKFTRHCLYVAAALLMFAALLHVPLHWWRRNMPWLLGVSLALCVAALFSAPSKGAARWIKLFGFSFQVSEMLKFAAALTLACWGRLIVENGVCQGASLRALMRPLAPLGLFLAAAAAIMVLQKDLGTIVLLASVALLVLVLAGLPWRYVALGGGLLLAAAFFLVTTASYRMKRVLAFVDPFAAPYGDGFAQLHSLMAYANGGWLGVGGGGSLQKNLIPEVHNDFIIAVIAEEYGLLGFFAVCALYLFVAMRSVAIGRAANSRREVFGAFYAFIFAALLLVQAVINIGGSLAVLPSKGITLPLISYGGSSLLATAAMLAVLLRLDYENKQSAAQQP